MFFCLLRVLYMLNLNINIDIGESNKHEHFSLDNIILCYLIINWKLDCDFHGYYLIQRNFKQKIINM